MDTDTIAMLAYNQLEGHYSTKLRVQKKMRKKRKRGEEVKSEKNKNIKVKEGSKRTVNN